MRVRAVEGAETRGERLGERAEAQRHVVRQLVDLGAGQVLEVDVDVLGKAAPEMRRLFKAQIAAIIDRSEAFVALSG